MLLRPLAACLVLPLAFADFSSNAALAATRTVANCNDAGSGSLRDTIAHAQTGDTVSLTALTCSKISLVTGHVSVNQNDIGLLGPGAKAFTIAGALNHYGSGTLRIEALRITDNWDRSFANRTIGSCVYSVATVDLERATVTKCSGGGVRANSITARDSTISDSYRGIESRFGAVSISGSTISGNRSAHCAGMRLGGAEPSIPTVQISNSTISGNLAVGEGFYDYYNYGAGCIFGHAAISNTTVAFNRGWTGGNGGLNILEPEVTIESSLFAYNSNDLNDSVHVSGHNNLFTSRWLPMPPDTITTEPRLFPLEDNGGPTQTHALIWDSPAVDAGNNLAGLATDQRGPSFGRIIGAGPDIGAFESPSPPTETVPIGPEFTGSWFDPNQSGQGLMLEVLPEHRLLAQWFTFGPDGAQQAWFGGVASYEGNVAIISEVAQPFQGRWIPNFNPDAIVTRRWGRLILSFSDCNHGKVEFDSVLDTDTTLDFGHGSMNLTRLTLPFGLACPSGSTSNVKQSALRSIGSPGAVATDASGNIFFSSDPNLVYKLDGEGVLKRIAGAGAPGYSGDGGPAIQAQLNFPLSYPEWVADPVNYAPLIGGLTVDHAGNVYIADAYNNRVRKIDTNGIINTVVGTGAADNAGDGGLATKAAVHWPQGVALDAAGSLYVSTAYASLRKIASDGRISKLAGDNCGSGYLGPGLCLPEQIAVDAASNVLVPDGYCRVREVRADGSIATIAGADNVPSNGAAFTCGYSGDGGPATKAALSNPYAVALDKTGNILIADTGNSCIRKFGRGGVISTVAGICNTSVPGYAGDGGAATSARLDHPRGLAVDDANNLIIADTNNGRIRKVSADGTITTIAGNGGEQGSWTSVGNLTAGRLNHTATLLANGKVLVAGGSSGPTAELYDPSARSWAPTGSLVEARSQHTATLLPSGKVLLVGGIGRGCSGDACTLATAELYDPATGAWTATGGMQISRFGHTATLLEDGSVLVAGGYGTGYWDYGAGYVATVEIYDASTGTWSYNPASNMSEARTGHQAVRLQDGKVLVVGGANTSADGMSLASAELYDPVARTWSMTNSMAWPRFKPVATLLADGAVLVAGGDGLDHMSTGSRTTLSSAELYNPATKAFTLTSPLVAGQEGFTTSALPDGNLLVAGGFSARAPNWADATFYKSTFFFHTDSRQWLGAGDLHEARSGHTATVLIDGSILIAGGNGNSSALATAELFTPSVSIDASFTGNWFDPAQSGHGLMIEVLPENHFLALWFAFNPEGTGQSWFGGLGTYSGNSATISDVVLPTGGSWIPNFDPAKVVRNPWGTLKFTFTDCNHGKVDFNSTLGYGTGSMNLTRLTMPAGLSCP